MAPSFETMEAALRAWVRNASGFGDAHVMWSRQNAQKPSGQYIDIQLDTLPAGAAWTKGRAAEPSVDGAERELVTQKLQEMKVTLTCFDGPAAGTSSPTAILSKLLLYAEQPARLAAFRTAGLGYLRHERVMSIPGSVAFQQRPRAWVDVFFSFAQEAIQTGTYVDSVEVTLSDNNDTPYRDEPLVVETP